VWPGTGLDDKEVTETKIDEQLVEFLQDGSPVVN